MKTIDLTQGHVALVDDEDFEYINQFKWQARFNKPAKCFYASRYVTIAGRRIYVAMHREIMQASVGEVVDHIHHNTLDNRRSELRIVNHSMNNINHRLKGKGISWCASASKYTASIMYAGTVVDLGLFNSVEEAEAKREDYSRKLFESYRNYISNFSPPPP